MTTVNDILQFVETLAPPALKMDWDNVGLLCGSKTAFVSKVLVALDPFEGVCREAAEWGAELLVTHHPLIFRPLSSVTDETAVGRAVQLLCKNGICAVNAHTNLDIASGGVNDALAEALGLKNVRVIGSAQLLRAGEVPKQTLEAFLSLVKSRLGCKALRYVEGGKEVCAVAVGGGSCADELQEAIAAGCDTFVTADVRYNQFWDAFDSRVNLIDAGHFYTENPVVAVLAAKIAAQFPKISVKISETHADCMKFY